MPNSRCLIIKMTKTQHERVRNNAEAKGYKTISSYIRSIALEHDLSFQKKIDELYYRLINAEDNGEKLKSNTKLTKFL